MLTCNVDKLKTSLAFDKSAECWASNVVRFLEISCNLFVFIIPAFGHASFKY
jgi:hypothetical protein